MPSLSYYAYEGAGEWARDNLGYSQAVRIGDRIECSGQGGWNTKSTDFQFSSDANEQIDQAFRNVDVALKDAGGKGLEQVFRVNSYHTEITPEITARMSENFKKWMPNHKPIWTQIGVKMLGVPEMTVEIEVVAYVP